MHALSLLILTWTTDETGTSTEWSSLPTPVEQSFTLASVHDVSVLVIADFSSVQSDASAAFRILIDATIVALVMVCKKAPTAQAAPPEVAAVPVVTAVEMRTVEGVRV